MSRHRSGRSGFTLIELLVVVVIIGIIASIAIPKFADTKGKANIAAVKSDLHNLAMAEEAYFVEHQTYTTSVALLNTVASEGVTLTVVEGTATGWSATAVHPAAVPVTCSIYYGSATPVAPATAPGQTACSR